MSMRPRRGIAIVTYTTICNDYFVWIYTAWLQKNVLNISPDSKVDGAKMGIICGRQDLGGSHVGPINFAIWECIWHYPRHSLMPNK